jgi:hypothetical protein
MGSWGIGLYQDDDALDLKGMIALLARLPASGDRLLKIILENRKNGVSLRDDGGPTFWLVLADQFERRGIACEKAFQQALKAIDTGADLRDLENRDSTPRDLEKRAAILKELRARLRSPRPVRTRPKGTRPPAFCVEVGEVYRFPTMQIFVNDLPAYEAFNVWFPTWERAGFKPDAWGAMLIYAKQRVFDWFPLCAASSLTVNPRRAPTLDDARNARFISAIQAGSYIVPRPTHLKKMRAELLGRLALDPAKTRKLTPRDAFGKKVSPQFEALSDSSFPPEARGWQGSSKGGVAVADLLEREQ